MAGTNGTHSYVEGVVTSTNSKGLKLAELDHWVNYSQYASEGAIEHAAVGNRVRLTLDKSGFIRQLVVLGAQQQPAPAAAPTVPAVANSAPAMIDRDTSIVRQSSVKAALDFLNHNEHSYSLDDLFAVAASIEAWVYRS